MSQNYVKTICTLLTPQGRGAVAVIAIKGPEAQSTIEINFKPICGKSFSQTAPRTIVYGIWESTGEDLVVFRRRPDDFEIHCHGGNTASSAVLQCLTGNQVKQLAPIEFKTRSDGLWKTEALEALSKATTNRTANLLLRQVDLLPKNIEAIIRNIESHDLAAAFEKIDDMSRWSDFGVHLTKPRSIVLCGRPNVGKSSLANTIVGFQRAIVHDTPGTTRDVVSQQTAIDGWPVKLSDTAGLRESDDKIESIGIQKAKSQIQSADLRICVFDLSQPWGPDDNATLTLVNPDMIVHNKSDLASPPGDVQQGDLSTNSRPEGILVSAQSGKGIDQLIEQIGDELVKDMPNPDQAIPISLHQAIRLRELKSQLSNVSRSGLDSVVPAVLSKLSPHSQSNE